MIELHSWLGLFSFRSSNAAALVSFGKTSKTVFIELDVADSAKQTSQLQKSSQPATPKSVEEKKVVCLYFVDMPRPYN